MAQVYDETEYIYSSINLVRDNIFIGSALTMIVLMLFLHLGVRALITAPLLLLSALGAVYVSPWFFAITIALILGAGFWFARGALVVGLAIPISIVGTFLMLSMMGRSLNVISLAGLAFAVGMLVDNAVVVLENVYTHYYRGERPFVAAVRGTQEVWGAVVASTLTTVFVFVPVVFVQEEAGQLFRDIALAISSAVGLSLIVSVTVIPPAAGRLFGRRDEDEDETTAESHATNGHSSHTDSPRIERPIPTTALGRISEAIVWPIRAGGSAFVRTVLWITDIIQSHTIIRLLFTGGMVAATLAVAWLLWPKVEYLPTGNRNLVFGILLPPPGYNLDQLIELGQKVENDLKPYWDIDPNSPEAQKLDFPVIGDFFFVARGRQVFLGIRAAEPDRVGELVPLVSKVGRGLPGTFAVAKQSSLFEQGLTAGRTIDVEIIGPELPQLVSLGGQILGGVMQAIPTAQAIPKPSLDLSSPEVHVEPKLMQAAEMGFNTADLGYIVDALVDGAYATDYYIGGDKIDLTIRGRDLYASRTQDIEALPLATSWGQLVPLGAVANVTMSSGPEQINHRERFRAITIEVSPPPEMPLEEALTTIQQQVIDPLRAKGQFDGGYTVNLSGTADKLNSTWNALRWNILLALLITYLLMAALYESWLYPLVIIFSVPLGAVGGLAGLFLLNLFVRWQL